MKKVHPEKKGNEGTDIEVNLWRREGVEVQRGAGWSENETKTRNITANCKHAREEREEAKRKMMRERKEGIARNS